jgi:IS1 family transposase
MNTLNREAQVAVVGALTEGCSIRSTSRMTGVDRETVGVLLKRVGDGCEELLDDTMRDLPCNNLELDELWAFVGKKQRQVREGDDSSKGDTWTWLAIDKDTKLVPCFLVGKRTDEDARIFVNDLANRLAGRVQISTDGLRAYIPAIGAAFGRAGVDYAQCIKSYEAADYPAVPTASRYSPPRVSGVEKNPVFGAPDEDKVSTSYAERVNLSVRMMGRRYTRLTNAFSKKLDMHVASTALTLAAYNFVRQHKTIRCSPAMAAGIAPTLWSVADLVEAALDGVRP